MSTDIQTLLTSIEELKVQFSQSIEVLTKSVSLIQTQIDSDTKTREETALKFIDFFSEELTKHTAGGKLFVAKMNHIRLNFDKMSYQSLVPVYVDLVNKPTSGWAKRRQVLLTASAIWRYTFHGKSSVLKSQIEASVSCSDCGAFSQAMVNRMISEGLWV